MLKAYESDEFHLQDMKVRLKNILAALTIIIDGKYQEQRGEILAWLVVADGMMQFSFSSSIAELVNRRLVNFSSDERFGNRDVMLVTFGALCGVICDNTENILAYTAYYHL